MTTEKYLNMQKSFYDAEAAKWSLKNKDPVVGSYKQHDAWPDYDEYLFKFNPVFNVETNDMVALEYGCGPGRNLIRFHNRFARIDGVDISQINLDKAEVNLADAGITDYNLYMCDGKSIPCEDETYDVVFSVICLQHIACHEIRFNIMKEIHRVLKPGGHFCFQMGYGGRGGNQAEYYENNYDAPRTNGGWDVAVRNEDGLKDDLTKKIGFKSYSSDVTRRGPGDSHAKWIWVRVQK